MIKYNIMVDKKVCIIKKNFVEYIIKFNQFDIKVVCVEDEY